MLPSIKGFTPSTLIDWEGKIASILFLGGCNLRCPYCHASALVLHPDELDEVPIEAVQAYFKQNEGWIDGAVICGGEPALHAGLDELCLWLHERGLAVKLDTNGTRPGVVERLIEKELVEAVAMDVKAPFDERYHRAAGVECDVAAIERTARMLIETGIEHEFRTTVCPAVVSEEDILDIVRSLQGAQSYVLQQFRPVDCIDPSMEVVLPWSMEKLREIAKAAVQLGCRCHVRGDTA